MLRRVSVAASALLFGSVLGLIPASSASADPPGCSKWNNGIWQSASNQLQASGGGSCNSSQQRTLYVEIKQDISWQPDPVAVLSGDQGNKQSYWAQAKGCDFGNVGTYYSRVYFVGHSDYADSSHVDFDVC